MYDVHGRARFSYDVRLPYGIVLICALSPRLTHPPGVIAKIMSINAN
jgi:hypothetical protein